MRHLCLTAIHPPLNSIQTPLDSRLTFIQIESHPNPGPHNCISPPSRWHLTSSQAPTIASQIHRDTISDPHRFQNVHLTSILALAHLNPEPKNIASPPSMYPLTSIQVHRFPSYTYPGNVSNPSTHPRLTSHIPPVHVSPQSSSRYLHLTSTQMMSHLHPCPRILVSPPSQSHLTISRSQVARLNSIQVHSQPHPGLWDLCLISIQAPRFMSPLHPSWASPQSRCLYLHITYTQVTSHFHPGPTNWMHISCMHYLKPMYVSQCVLPPASHVLTAPKSQ